MDEFKENPSRYEEAKRSLLHWVDASLIEEAYVPLCSLRVSYHRSKEPFPWNKRKELFPHTLHEGERWSKGEFPCAWFHISGKVPEGTDLNRLYICFRMGGEALLYDGSGKPLKGFSNGGVAFSSPTNFRLKRYYPLKDLVKNGKVDLWLDGGDNSAYQPEVGSGVLHEAKLVLQDPKTVEILSQVEVLLEEYLQASLSLEQRDALYSGLCQIRDLYLYHWPDRYEKALPILHSLWSKTSSSNFSLYAVGHSHLDLGWLWPIRETKRKAIRTLSNAFYLLERYPQFTYSISQPQQVAWVEKEAPTLFAKLQDYVRAGRIELLGGSWVEHDLNNIGEEALMRQMLYGQKYWLEHFGHYTEVGWLPDDFGFIPSLPEVLKTTNQSYFFTSKLHWCQETTFPYSFFQWKGLDGSSVLTHSLIAQNDYVGRTLPSDLKYIENHNPEVGYGLFVYGAGDGGGGPSEEDLLRLPYLDHTLDLPHVKETHVLDFFRDLSKEKNLPTYSGELYLENHQGTYTSQSEIKQKNRLMEDKLRAVEIYLAEKGITTFDSKLNEIWKEVLLYQFHDILPGSSIQRIYDEALARYDVLNQELDEILSIASDQTYHSQYHKGDYVRNFSSSATKHYEKKGNAYYAFDLPSNGETNVSTRYIGHKFTSLMEFATKHFTIRFAADGSFKNIIDRENGKDILNGYGNRFRVYRDGLDLDYANWNIMPNYRNQPELYMDLRARHAKRYGPITEIISEYAFHHSRLTETMQIDDDSRVIRFRHKMDWKDDNYMVKACFALRDMPPFVRCDTPFGYQERSTLNDTPHHRAQFELCAYRWFDFSSDENGVAFFNHTKGGFYAKEGKVELTLLRSANYPCPHMDQHPTTYDYAIYVHAKPFAEAEVDNQANLFCMPCFYFHHAEAPKNTILVSDPDIQISCFKNAYSGEGLIVRLYERSGRETDCRLSVPASCSSVVLVTGLEDPIDVVDPNNLHFRPFEIKTIWLH